MEFTWDSEKAFQNVRKHGIRFEAAIQVFLDENRLITIDNRQNYGEERLVTLGMIENRLHVVVYTERHEGIRIISARKANKREQKHYVRR